MAMLPSILGLLDAAAWLMSVFFAAFSVAESFWKQLGNSNDGILSYLRLVGLLNLLDILSQCNLSCQGLLGRIKSKYYETLGHCDYLKNWMIDHLAAILHGSDPI